MNIKKSAYDAIQQRLENDLSSLQGKIARNKWEFKKLAGEQAGMKRERGILRNLIRDLKVRRDAGIKQEETKV